MDAPSCDLNTSGSFFESRSPGDALDGPVVVDLRDTDPALLEPFMGRESMAAFRR